MTVFRDMTFLATGPASERSRSAAEDIVCMLTWDCSHDYVLHRFWHDLTRVTIRFKVSPPSVQELASIRRCLPEFRNMAPAAARERIGDSRELSLGVLPTQEARRVLEWAQAEGLEVIGESASFASYLPFNRTTGCAWLIEDDTEAAAVLKAMLEAGIPVQDVKA
jgi:hypothetical protein